MMISKYGGCEEREVPHTCVTLSQIAARNTTSQDLKRKRRRKQGGT